jgi:hypothetical protein
MPRLACPRLGHHAQEELPTASRAQGVGRSTAMASSRSRMRSYSVPPRAARWRRLDRSLDAVQMEHAAMAQKAPT